MTEEQIQHQIEVINLVGAKLLKSKEDSRRFLIAVGIIKEKKKRKPSPKKK